ncbi:hypothetical protein HN954_02920 [bacterium]|nr:hypothetical protein [bacterium]MBT6831450.1 hypothetical protein [bacterium]MBT6996356.1 hypothetical protein [bacterium]MBT7772423.1 hypothetical protein [bacterium]
MSPLIILFGFALAMIGISFLSRQKNIGTNVSEFLLASRNVGTIRGAFSIAISWVWAPAIFIAGLQAYTKGLAGAFWFIIPNILCFFLFARVAKKIRNEFPEGFTLPQYIKERFKSKRTHYAFLAIFFGYQLGAIIINCVAGGALLNLLTGIDFKIAVGAISGTALIYSLVGGMRASILTDVIQMIIVLGLAVFIVPWVVVEAGGISAITGGFAGISGEGVSIFNPSIAWMFGIPMTISLLSGPIGDQQFFQRAFAVKKESVTSTFNIGGVIFGLIPIILCLLGFIVANPSLGVEVSDPQMVAPAVIGTFLPSWALGLFTLMAFAGLCSTIDSAYCAISSFGVADLGDIQGEGKTQIRKARWAMVILGLIGTGFALLEPKLLWVFLIYGVIVSIGFFPTLFSVFSKRYNEQTAFYSILLGLIGAVPLSIYANVSENTDMVVYSAILSVLIGLLVSVIGLFLSKRSS